MTTRDRIHLLLEHYRDVLEGLADGAGAGDDVQRMDRAWRTPAYQELERLLPIMRERWPRLYVHLRKQFLDYVDVRQGWCRKCGWNAATKIGSIHAHPPGRSVTLIPRMRRMYPVDLDPQAVEDGLEWLGRHWDPRALDIPQKIMRIETSRKLRQAA